MTQACEFDKAQLLEQLAEAISQEEVRAVQYCTALHCTARHGTVLY